jgi:hypothetical protein
MTLSSTTVLDDYNGDGSTVDFATTFVFWNSSELKVILTSSSGVETTWTEGTEYDVTGGSGAVGTVSASTTGTDYTPDTGETLRVKSNVLDIQETSLPAGGAFPSTSVEEELDRTVRRIQQQQEQFDRAALLSEASTFTGLTMPDPVANAYVVFNSDGDDLTTSSTGQSQWLGGDGTVSLPYYSFSADPDSGVYRIGANNVGIAVNGAKALDIDTSGINGAIGQTTPAAGTFSAITSGGNVVSDTDSTDDLGTTGVRWNKLWVDDITMTNDLEVGNDLTVTGDLTVNGTAVTHNVTNYATEDVLIELNTGSTVANTSDLGIMMERGTTGDNAFMGWDETADEFVVATTTDTGTTAGNISLTYADFQAKDVTMVALSCSSGTIAGVTSFGLQTGATITAGILDEDAMGSDSAVALATQQSIKAYSDSNAVAPGFQMTFSSTTNDGDAGVGKVWWNHANSSQATVVYLDDVENGSVSINDWVDSMDDPTHATSGTLTIMEGGAGSALSVFNVTGAVTSAATYSKVAVTPVANVGTFTDADICGVTFARAGDDGDALLANDNTWTGNQTFSAKITLDGTPGTDHTAVGPQTNTFNAGYSSTIMDLVYLGSSGKWLEADADATGTSINMLGIALEAKTDTQTMNVALPGSFVRDDTWNWTIGVPLYVSGTLGAITATAPSGSGDVVRPIGFAVTADVIYFNPSPDYATVA